MRLSDVLDQNSIVLGVPSATKETVLASLVGAVKSTCVVCDKQSLLASILERERLKSTALGGGTAIPHARCASLKGLAASLGIIREGVEFGAGDGKPVHVVFLVACEEGKDTQYLRLISHAATLFKDESFTKSLLGAQSPDEVLRLIADQEACCLPHLT